MGLVAEMRADLDQLLHGDGNIRHDHFLSGYASGKLEPCGSPRCGTGMGAFHVNLPRPLLPEARRMRSQARAP